MRIQSASATGISDGLRILWKSGVGATCSDAECLSRFLELRDETAFAALVDRHGAMVMRVCLGSLRDRDDADDAWQATFLLLARRAASIRSTDSVGAWLLGVARRVALRSRTEKARRALLLERLVSAHPAERFGNSPATESWCELHDEIDRLPPVERSAIVTCDLEGLSHEQAAARLCWPIRSLRKRLYRGRSRLKARLIRRGLTLAPGVVGAVLCVPAAASARMVVELAKTDVAPAAVSFLMRGISTSVATRWSKSLVASLVGAIAISCVGLIVSARQDPAKPTTDAEIGVNRAIRQATESKTPTERDARELLRRAAEVAIAIGHDPRGSWALADLAIAQSKAGDHEGAKATFNAAVADALAQDEPQARDLWRVGHFQWEEGYRIDATGTLRKAAELGAKLGPRSEDQAIPTLNAILLDQMKLRDEQNARLTLAAMRAIHEQQDSRRDPFTAAEFVAALAVGGEVDEAFAEVERLLSQSPGNSGNAVMALGKMADAVSELDREVAKPVVERIAKRMAMFELFADEQVHPILELSHAFARVGRFDEARAMALTIGRGKQRGNVDVTDTQPYALLLIATEQDAIKDRTGALETLRIALKTIDDDPKMRGRDGRYMQVAEFLARFGDPKSARSALDKMKGEFRRELLTNIARSERARGDEDAAKADFAAAIELARAEIVGLIPTGAPNTIVDEASKADLNAGEAHKLGSGLAALAEIQAESGDYAGAKITLKAALRVKDPIKQSGTVRQSYVSVARGWAASGDLAGAIALALQADTPASKRTALAGVAMGYRIWKQR